MKATKAEIKRRIQKAIARTHHIGDEIYYPAWWSYDGDYAPDCTTSVKIMHDDTARAVRLSVAAGHVAETLGLDDWYGGDISTLDEAVASIHSELALEVAK